MDLALNNPRRLIVANVMDSNIVVFDWFYGTSNIVEY